MNLPKDIYSIINDAIDFAFHHEKYNLNFFQYLTDEKLKQADVKVFNNSSTALAIKDQIDELDLYLAGGSEASFINEAYDWMGRDRANKIRVYLNQIMEDAKRYEQSKRKGRKKKVKSDTTK